MQHSVLLTGATGQVGRELLSRLLVREDGTSAVVMLRATDGAHAEQRLKALLEELFGENRARAAAGRVRAIAGDLELERFGLGDAGFNQLAGSVNEVIHSAASTNLGNELEVARKSNVRGTKSILDLGQCAEHPMQLHHIATAYVAGDIGQTVEPNYLNLTAPFRNGYEQSKAEAEALVRDAAPALRPYIYRPSMIVGDSVTGQTTSFNVIYILARFLLRGIGHFVPARPNAPFDIVPVDYVADAILDLRNQPDLAARNFHITAGVGRETSPREIVEAIVKTIQFYKQKGLDLIHAPTIISPELLHSLLGSLSVANLRFKNIEQTIVRQLRFVRQVWHLIPYLTTNPRFNAGATTLALGGLQPQPPLFKDYAERVFSYCIDTNWGKRQWTNPQQLTTWLERELLVTPGSPLLARG